MLNDHRSPFGIPTDPRAPNPIQSPAILLDAGQMIGGRYVVRGRIGAGGMGSVYRVHDRELSEDIALKIVSAEHAGDPQMLERLRREVKLARKIAHANVCKVFDYGESEGLRFLTMELIEGQNLRTILRDGPVLSSRVSTIVGEVAAGLSAGHEQGIVHRDLKPENVVLRSNGQAVLVDFGLARHLSGEQKSEVVAGTPSYMSPEQLRGEALDQRSDVFALGVLSYELLSTMSPFDQGSYAATVSAILRDPPKPLKLPTPSSIPLAHVEAVLLKALAKSPEARFSSALDFADALRQALGAPLKPAALSNEHSAIQPKGTWYRTLLKRRAGLLILLLFVTTGVVLLYMRSPKPSENEKPIAATFAAVGRASADQPIIAIARFRNSTGDPAKDQLVNSAGEAIRAGLLKYAELRILEVGRSGDPHAMAQTQGATWIMTGNIQASEGGIHITAHFERPAGGILGEAMHVDMPAHEGLGKGLDLLQRRVYDEAGLLLREYERLRRAREGTKNSQARDKLIRYYEEYYTKVVRGAAEETFRVGKSLLDEAIVQDADYVPALIERAFLQFRVGSATLGPDPQAAGRADLERALAIEPRNPPALILRCRLLRFKLEEHETATDQGIKDVMEACDAALDAAPNSAEVHLYFALLYDRQCKDSVAIRSLDTAREVDRAYTGQALRHLVELSLQNDDLGRADADSLELLRFEEEERRLGPRSLSARQGISPTQEAPLLRAAVLLRLKRKVEAGTELEKQMKWTSSEASGDSLKAAAMHGLLKLLPNPSAEQINKYKDQLTLSERRFEEEIEKDLNNAPDIATYYQYVDPKAAIRWIELANKFKSKTQPPSCDESVRLAQFYNAAGQIEKARNALAQCKPLHDWERTCMDWMKRRLNK